MYDIQGASVRLRETRESYGMMSIYGVASINSQQITGLTPFFEKLVDLGFVSPRVFVMYFFHFCTANLLCAYFISRV